MAISWLTASSIMVRSFVFVIHATPFCGYPVNDNGDYKQQTEQDHAAQDE
jgi:hypothetical protein